MSSSAARQIAIDGPAGAGKSTAARALAGRLGWFLLDTGAIYRSVALAAHEAEVAWDDEERLAAIARDLPIAFAPRPGEEPSQAVLLDGRDVTRAIRTTEMSDGASRVSALPAVRASLLELQRRLARAGDCVVEGRDIGTVVLPDAPLKLFVTASAEERARRRHAELLARGQESDLAKTLAEIKERDARDSGRAVAPLKPAKDAILLDTSELTLDEVVAKMLDLAQERLAI